jgi:hypothetical protein
MNKKIITNFSGVNPHYYPSGVGFRVQFRGLRPLSLPLNPTPRGNNSVITPSKSVIIFHNLALKSPKKHSDPNRPLWGVQGAPEMLRIFHWFWHYWTILGPDFWLKSSFLYDQWFRFMQPTKSSFQRFLFEYFVLKLGILTIFLTNFRMKQLFVRGSCSAPVELLFSSCSAPKLMFGACSVLKQKGVVGLAKKSHTKAPGAAVYSITFLRQMASTQALV